MILGYAYRNGRNSQQVMKCHISWGILYPVDKIILTPSLSHQNLQGILETKKNYFAQKNEHIEPTQYLESQHDSLHAELAVDSVVGSTRTALYERVTVDGACYVMTFSLLIVQRSNRHLGLAQIRRFKWSDYIMSKKIYSDRKSAVS